MIENNGVDSHIDSPEGNQQPEGNTIGSIRLDRRTLMGGAASIVLAHPLVRALGTGATLLSQEQSPTPSLDIAVIDDIFNHPKEVVPTLNSSMDPIHIEGGAHFSIPGLFEVGSLVGFLPKWFGSQHGEDHNPLLHNLALATLYGAEVAKGMDKVQADLILGAQVYALAYGFGEKIIVSDALVEHTESVKLPNGQNQERKVLAQPSFNALQNAKILTQFLFGALLTNTGVARPLAAIGNVQGEVLENRLQALGYDEDQIRKAQQSMIAHDVAKTASVNSFGQPSYALKATTLLGIHKPWNPIAAVIQPLVDLPGKAQVGREAIDAGLVGVTLITQVVEPILRDLLPGDNDLQRVINRVAASRESASLFMGMLKTLDYE